MKNLKIIYIYFIYFIELYTFMINYLIKKYFLLFLIQIVNKRIIK